jgi:hypothetical protein
MQKAVPAVKRAERRQVFGACQDTQISTPRQISRLSSRMLGRPAQINGA